MTDEQWQAVWKLYRSTDSVAAEDIPRLLTDSGADPAVRAEVMELLASRQVRENPSRDQTQDWTGRRIGRYVLTQHLADGGMGEVYAARDSELGRPVAIKLLGARVHGAASVERFSAEARSASALNHPNIVTIYEVIHTGSRLAIVMELVDGIPLRKLCGSSVPVDRLVNLGQQTAKALSAAHAKGIVHCDIKPENLMLRPDGLIKVLDFGLARDLASMIHNTTQSAGTLRYMSPEQSKGKVPAPASDIFSLGIVLYELSTGAHPFDRGSIFETLDVLNGKEPVPPSTLNAYLPHGLDTLILSMLAKDPALRPTAAVVGQALESRLLDEPWQGHLAKPEAKPRRRFRLGLPASLAALVAAAALIALFVWEHRAPLREAPLVQLDLDVEGEVSQFAISPDGTEVVLVKGNQLALRRLDQSAIRPLDATDGASYPFFSPDGKWVAFFAGGRLRKIAVEGGAPVTLCDAQSGRGGSWGEEGQIVAALKSTGGLYLVPAAGGPPRPFTDLKGDLPGVTSHRWPQFLPHGHGMLFTATVAGGAIGSLRVLPSDGQPMKTIVEDCPYGRFVAGGYLVYYQHGRLFAAPFDLDNLRVSGAAFLLEDHVAADTTRGAIFEVSPSGTLIYRRGDDESSASLSWVNAAGAIQSILPNRAAYLTPRLSPDGKRLAMAIAKGAEQNLWLYDFDKHAETRATFGGDSQLFPVWTADGEFIVFRSGNSLAWVRSDGGGNVQRVQTGSLNPLPYSISLDNKWLAFAGDNPVTGLDLYVSAIARNPAGLVLGTPRAFLREPAGQYAPAISPDGHWMAYVSDESGRGEIYVAPFAANGTAGEGRWQVSSEGGVYPVWSRSGAKLLYRRGDRRIMEVNYQIRGGSFVTGQPRLWTQHRLSVAGGFQSFDIASDGSRALGVFEPADSAAEVVLRVLLNVDRELKRQKP